MRRIVTGSCFALTGLGSADASATSLNRHGDLQVARVGDFSSAFVIAPAQRRNSSGVFKVAWRRDESMGYGASTLLDILSSQQFRALILLTLGLDICQIADFLETSERTVCDSLSDCFDRAGCRNAEELALRLVYECENDLYDERFVNELTELQSAAKRMLGAAPPARLSASVEKS